MPEPSDDTAIDVCVVGSANLDLVATTARLPAPGETVIGSSFASFAGGKGLNQAVAAARAGAAVAFHGAIGDDAAGEALAAVLADAGVPDVGLRRIAGVPTGRAIITVDDAAENTIVVVPGANAHVEIEALATTRVVLAQLEVPLDTVRRAFAIGRAQGAVTILDPTPARPLDDELLALVDVIVPNEHEVGLLGGVAALHRAGVRTVITTLGAAGVRVEEATRAWSVGTVPVSPVDTTGAGDSFRGHLAAALAAGSSLTDAVARANVAGALATTVRGAVPSIPWRAQVDAVLSDAGGPPPSRPG